MSLDPEPFLGADLYEMTEDDRRRELIRRALEADERARKGIGKSFCAICRRTPCACDRPYDW
jgi:hypothetical protein